MTDYITAGNTSPQTTNPTGYNGWSNYETWCVSLWLSNDQDSYNATCELIRETSNTIQAADNLKSFVEEANPLADHASMFADLMYAALSEVDWVEIVESFLDEEG